MDNYQELIAQKEALDKQIEAVRQADRAEAIAQAKRMVVFFGLSAAELGLAPAPAVKRAKRVQKALPAKYFGPNGETWSGHGRAPKWLTGDRNQYLGVAVPDPLAIAEEVM